MAKIQEEIIVIKVSQICKDNDAQADVKVNDDVIMALTQVAEELIGSGAVVEIERA